MQRVRKCGVADWSFRKRSDEMRVAIANDPRNTRLQAQRVCYAGTDTAVVLESAALALGGARRRAPSVALPAQHVAGAMAV